MSSISPETWDMLYEAANHGQLSTGKLRVSKLINNLLWDKDCDDGASTSTGLVTQQPPSESMEQQTQQQEARKELWNILAEAEQYCSYCAATGQPRAKFLSHNKVGAKGEVQCPVLLHVVCPNCNKRGHEPANCPLLPVD